MVRPLQIFLAEERYAYSLCLFNWERLQSTLSTNKNSTSYAFNWFSGGGNLSLRRCHCRGDDDLVSALISVFFLSFSFILFYFIFKSFDSSLTCWILVSVDELLEELTHGSLLTWMSALLLP